MSVRQTAAVAGFALATMCSVAAPAYAVDVECIEASKYKYIYQLFDNDTRRAAAYFRVNPAQLPIGETCRAMLVTGRVTSSKAAKRDGDRSDANKLFQAIQQSRGWLAVLYLASPGGDRQSGLALGRLTRMFWLKTIAVEETDFEYYPDVGTLGAANVVRKRSSRAVLSPVVAPLPVAGFERGYAAYIKSAPISVQIKTDRKRTTCASACTFMHVAGVDRRGTMYVHRGRKSSLSKKGEGRKKAAEKISMAETAGAMRKTQAPIIAYYREMDAGEAVIDLQSKTSTWTTAGIAPARFPGSIDDILQARCGGDAVALEQGESRAREALGQDDAKGSRAKKALAKAYERRSKIEPCIVQAHESERLKQFAKFCPNGKCDSGAISRVLQPKREKRKR